MHGRNAEPTRSFSRFPSELFTSSRPSTPALPVSGVVALTLHSRFTLRLRASLNYYCSLGGVALPKHRGFSSTVSYPLARWADSFSLAVEFRKGSGYRHRRSPLFARVTSTRFLMVSLFGRRSGSRVAISEHRARNTSAYHESRWCLCI
jgi:hypothetical protein